MVQGGIKGRLVTIERNAGVGMMQLVHVLSSKDDVPGFPQVIPGMLS